MKIGGTRNAGWGRSMKFAVRNLLRDKYGDGRYGTRRSHQERLNHFLAYLRSIGINDVMSIERAHIEQYAERLAASCEAGDLGRSTAINRISSANVVWKLLNNGSSTVVRPVQVIGRRSLARVDEPVGLVTEKIQTAIRHLVDEDLVRLALVIAICRYAGARFREASLLPLREAREQVRKTGDVEIRLGTKGGKGRSQPRVISASTLLQRSLEDLVPRIDESNVIPGGMKYVQWYRYAHKQWAERAPVFNLESKYHDLRASYACQRYEELTGTPAPCVKRRGVVNPEEMPVSPMADFDARKQIAIELGHRRVDVVATYCGGQP